jgi:subtilase family serine protease
VYLEPGESKLVTWTLSLQDAGEYQVKVGDLFRMVRVAGDALPDLEVSAILPAEAVADQGLTINFTVWNRGESEAPMFSVTLYCDGAERGFLLMGPLQAGTALDSIFSWVPGSSGEYAVRIVVDEEGYVTELSKDNNEFQATIFVVEPGVDYYRIAITLGLLIVVLLSILVPYYMLKLRKTPKPGL